MSRLLIVVEIREGDLHTRKKNITIKIKPTGKKEPDSLVGCYRRIFFILNIPIKEIARYCLYTANSS